MVSGIIGRGASAPEVLGAAAPVSFVLRHRCGSVSGRGNGATVPTGKPAVGGAVPSELVLNSCGLFQVIAAWSGCWSLRGEKT